MNSECCAGCNAIRRSRLMSSSQSGAHRAPFTVPGFNWLVKRAGVKANMPFQVHAHMLRHACGFNVFLALKDEDFHSRSLTFQAGEPKMASLFSAGDITLANTGNCIFRLDGSSLDGLTACGVSRVWQKPGPELTVVKPARLFPKVELLLNGGSLANAPHLQCQQKGALPPRPEGRGFRAQDR
jgi:hypothetical protein